MAHKASLQLFQTTAGGGSLRDRGSEPLNAVNFNDYLSMSQLAGYWKPRFAGWPFGGYTRNEVRDRLVVHQHSPLQSLSLVQPFVPPNRCESATTAHIEADNDKVTVSGPEEIRPPMLPLKSNRFGRPTPSHLLRLRPEVVRKVYYVRPIKMHACSRIPERECELLKKRPVAHLRPYPKPWKDDKRG